MAKDKNNNMNNFKAAFKELLNGEKAETSAPEPKKAREPQPEAVSRPAERVQPEIKQPEPQPEPVVNSYQESVDYEPLQNMNMFNEEPEEEVSMQGMPNESYPETMEAPTVRSKTIIAQDVEITGDIKTKGDIDIMGDIKGNVVSDGHVMVSGAVQGSVVAESADFEGGTLAGESIQIASHITVNQGVEIIGEVQAVSLEVNGRIQGNINVADQIVLHSGADVTGDINAQYISIQKGAVINGNLRINQQSQGEE